MCGIFASFAPSSNVSLEELHRCTAKLKHRGPESVGHWLAKDRKVALGHARLAIVDLMNGSQPLSNEADSLHVVVNGEFYGHKAIRAELEAKGHRFKSASDSEILVHLYEELQTSCLVHLRGEFAFSVWDERAQVLFAARDRFGVKPLYYAQHGERLYLASEVKAILSAGVPFKWDLESVYRSSFFALPQDRTLFESIKQVPPGHYLIASRRGITIRKYWDLNLCPETEKSSSADDQERAAEVRSKLEDAIRVRLGADVPVACYLSGGLDSSSVIGIASRIQKIPAFSLKFDHPALDESQIAAETATHCGVSINTVDIYEKDLAKHFSDAIWHSETLAFNSNGVAKYLLSKAVSESGYKVVLTGEGADEILAGYPHFKRDMLLHDLHEGNKAAPALASLQDANMVYGGLGFKHKLADPLRPIRAMLGYVPSMWESTFAIGSAMRNTFAPGCFRRFRDVDVFGDFLAEFGVLEQLKGRHPVHQSMYLWSKTFLPNYILTFLGDRMEMAHSVEGRVPFLDHELAETVAKMPVSAKLRDGTEKFVLREAVKDCVTETVYQRQKHPFAAPPYMTVSNGPLFQFAQDVLRSRDVEALPFVERKGIIKLLEGLSGLDRDQLISADAALTAILSACVLNTAHAPMNSLSCRMSA